MWRGGPRLWPIKSERCRTLQLLGTSIVMLAVAGGMAFYEWTRIKAGRPILKGHQAVTLYWVAYLTLFVLGVTTVLALTGLRVPPNG